MDNTGVITWITKLLEGGPPAISVGVFVASYFRLWMWRTDHVEAIKVQSDFYERILGLQTKRIDELTAERGKGTQS